MTRRRSELNHHHAQRSFLRRLWVIAFFVLFCFGLLFSRFAWLQIVHYEKYSQRADTNRLKFQSIAPMRGAIIDRNGVVLAYNEPSSYTLEITPSEVKSLDETIAKIQEFIPLTERDIKRFKRARSNARSQYEGIPLYSNLTQKQVAVLSTQLYRLQGVEINLRSIRKYPLEETASHIIGYLGGITENDIRNLTNNGNINNYVGTEVIGRVGIEAQYEQSLHGIKGVEELEVTARGRPVQRLREIGSKPGNIIQLTLDTRLQKLVEDLYGERRGAFVAIDPRNGEILALVSKPTFDPNQFIAGFDQESWSALNEAIDQPLFHRAIGGAYPIGSTYKPFMAMAGMQTGVRGPKETIVDTGSFTLGNRTWRGHAVGRVDARRAITVSSNSYFYSLGPAIGVDRIHDFMKPWGFGQHTGIDLGGEIKGTLPSTAWKKSAYKQPNQQGWYVGDTVNISIGQGHNEFTILQLASAVATLANRGQQFTPHLLLSDKNVMTGQITPFPNETPRMMDVKPEFIEVAIDGMAGVPKQGTARFSFAGAQYISAGKTGTAQAISVPQGKRYDASVLSEYKRDHSLYIAFAPIDNPQIAIAMIVENAGFGARSAVPIARRALDYYLQGYYPSNEDIIALQRNYAGPPFGQPRFGLDYDIFPVEQLVPLSMIEVEATEVNTWEPVVPTLLIPHKESDTETSEAQVAEDVTP